MTEDISRDEVIERVKRGQMTPDQAEAWAADKGTQPFADPPARFRENGRWQEYGTKPRTLMNWCMQAAGGEIIRIACAALTAAGVEVIAPVHDAVLVLADEGCREDIGNLVVNILERAAFTVVGGRIPVDRQWILPGDNWRPPKGERMWQVVARALDGHPSLRGVR